MCKAWEDIIREAAEKAAKKAVEEATIKAKGETESREPKARMGDMEVKLVATAAGFLGRQMEG